MEDWKEHPDYPGYEISNLGRVRSWHKTGYGGDIRTEPRLMKISVNGYGYSQIRLKSTDNRYIGKMLHHLVADLFLEAKPTGHFAERWVLDHIDGDRANATAANLRWTTQSINLRRSQKFKDRKPEQVPLVEMLRIWKLCIMGGAWTSIHKTFYGDWTYYKFQHWAAKSRALMEDYGHLGPAEIDIIIEMLKPTHDNSLPS